MADQKTTGRNTHRANQRGYDSARGILYEEGDLIDPGLVVSDEWMDPVDKKDRALAGAVEEALEPLGDIGDLNAASKPALEAMALERGINVQGLSKADLITAITAAHDNTR